MLSAEVEDIIQDAFQEAHRRSHDVATVEHLLYSLLEDRDIQQLLKNCHIDPNPIRSQLDLYLDAEIEKVSFDESRIKIEASLGFQRVIESATIQARSASRQLVWPFHLLVAIFDEKESPALYFLAQAGLSRLELVSHIGDPIQDDEEDFGDVSNALEAFTVNLTDKARNGELDLLVGRQEELTRTIHVLLRRRKNNPLLVGEAGVGKTAIAEGLAQKIVSGDVPKGLLDAQVYSLDLGLLLAGTRYRGDFENRFKALMKALREKPGAILLIDEIHNLVGAGSASGSGPDASNLLKPILSDGHIRCLGTTTYKEYRTHFEKDRALVRRFQRIDVGEPTEDDCLKILQGLKARYEEFHEVRINAKALQACVLLANRYLPDRHLPDKAIDILDEAAAGLKLKAKKNPIVSEQEIQATVARMAQIPAKQINPDDRASLRTLEQRLKNLVFGQDKAIEELSAAIKLSRAGLKEPEKPIGSFLFTGPSGVGKTEIAKQLANELQIALIRFDMSEYLERHAISRLIGAPPGYVGFEQGGLLTDAVYKTPHAVLLLDEIEKAHSDVYHMLLQVMDYGKLTDSNGRSTDFRHVVLIMTSNVGAQELAQLRIGFGDTTNVGADETAFKRLFSPEFRSRLDARISFEPLKQESMRCIVEKFLTKLVAQAQEQKVRLEITERAKDYLAQKGYDRALGARPLARVIQTEIKRPLAELILNAESAELQVSVDLDSSELRLKTLN
ncbi:MAG: AAA family ATPase [Myxococcaceae bacterium]|nr:AAA family ATPase [Myxococcaceae bacterium]MBH2005728.1 AAA family ATPase [Myxococcaceae bacterium]